MNDTATNRSILSQKAAAIIALFIGIMSVFAGSRVLLEIDIKDYNVLIWLVSYNVVFGSISIVVAYFIWRNSTYIKYLTLFVLTMHLIVFFYLKFFSNTVASESIKAMIFRVSIWLLIVVLSIIIPKYLNKQ